MADTQIIYTLNLKNAFSKGMKQAVDDTKRLDDEMNRFNKTLKGVGAGIAAYFSVGAIKNFGSAIIDSLKNYEYFSASLRTLLKGDRNMANALEDRLIGLAGITPYSLVDIQQGAKQMLAYGFAANKVVGNLKMLGDVSSGVGAPLTDIVYLYGTLRTQGRAYTRDIMQFTSRGIPIIAELAKQFGVTEDKVKDLVEAGKVGFKDVEKAFKSMTSEGGTFFKMMEEQSQTVGGKIERLGDAWEQLKVNIGKSQKGIISSTVSFFASLLEKTNNYFINSNAMEAAFKKYGAKDPGSGLSWQRAGMETVEREKLAAINQRYSDKMYSLQGDNVDPLKSRAGLHRLMEESAKEMATVLKFRGLTGRDEADRRVALLKSIQERIKGQLSLLDMPEQKLTKDTTASAGDSQAPVSSTEWSGARPQNININVNKLVETLNIEAADVAGGVQEGAALTKKAFLELLNDANQMANR